MVSVVKKTDPLKPPTLEEGSMYDLEGKVAVITGAGRPHGIGRATALRLAREGAQLVLADLGSSKL